MGFKIRVNFDMDRGHLITQLNTDRNTTLQNEKLSYLIQLNTCKSNMYISQLFTTC